MLPLDWKERNNIILHQAWHFFRDRTVGGISYLIKGLQELTEIFFFSLCPFIVWLCSSFRNRCNLFSIPLDLVWLCGLLWQKWHRGSSKPDLKRPFTVLLSLLKIYSVAIRKIVCELVGWLKTCGSVALISPADSQPAPKTELCCRLSAEQMNEWAQLRPREPSSWT